MERAPALEAWAVSPGDSLATIDRITGAEGLDVRDRPIPIPEPPDGLPSDPRLEPGPGVERSPDGSSLVASTFGYAGLDGGRLSVLEPLWISPDMMQACFLNLPLLDGSSAPSAGDLRALLEASGVTFGIDDAAVQTLSSRLPAEPLVPLANGAAPLAAADRLPAFTRDLEFHAGSFRDDGSIDFHERNIFPPVSDGDLLVESEAEIFGQPGQTVFGVETETPGGSVAIELSAGDNVRLSVEDGLQRLHSASDGGVVLSSGVTRDTLGTVAARQYHATVQPVAYMESDVGLKTGNIDFRGSVVVDGSVTSGFEVKATGGIAVFGSIESGVRLQAGGDITVEQGIVGRKTRVIADGVVRARFVQEARVEARGDIAIGSYAHSAHLQTRGRVQVEGLGGSADTGGLVGGETWALGGIATPNVGSPRSSSTRLISGVSVEDVDRLEKTRQSLQAIETELAGLLKSIDLTELTSEAAHELVARKPDQRDAIVAGVREARQLEEARDLCRRDEGELVERIAAIAARAPIDVAARAYADASLQVGDRQLVLKLDLSQVRFRADPDLPDLQVEPLEPPAANPASGGR